MRWDGWALGMWSGAAPRQVHSLPKCWGRRVAASDISSPVPLDPPPSLARKLGLAGSSAIPFWVSPEAGGGMVDSHRQLALFCRPLGDVEGSLG